TASSSAGTMPHSSSAPCPSDDDLVGLVEGQLDGAALGRLKEHVAGCRVCAGVVAGLGSAEVKAVRPSTTGRDGGHPQTPGVDVRWARNAVAKGTHGRIGHYEIIRSLGQGGMGEVYLARDTRLGRRVALKFLLEVDPNYFARFALEARATAQLAHENIVALY